jgi:hypothetical protein
MSGRFCRKQVQPAMTGLIHGSLSTLAPIFAVAFRYHQPRYAFFAGWATAIGAGTGDLTRRGYPCLRGSSPAPSARSSQPQNKGSPMLDTGFPRADVENEFLRARRHQVLAALAHRLSRQPHDGDRLLQLDEVTGALGVRGERHLGLQTICLDTIVGTAGSRRDFDRHFRPTSNRVRSRWEQLALAERRGTAIPPIEVYRVGSLHFVSDGHHRVSIAAATSQQTIDAYVTEILTTQRHNAAAGRGLNGESTHTTQYGGLSASSVNRG